ncbi:MAG: hypothetical protein LBS60_04940 [Deltaproteobacteria bacterium]|nr:hypothetical protein [Deltaproteobacteria bacterium]
MTPGLALSSPRLSTRGQNQFPIFGQKRLPSTKLRFRELPQVKNKDELSSVVGQILFDLKRDPKLIRRIFLKEEIQYITSVDNS